MLQNAFVDMENMFDMLHEPQEVKDEPDARALSINNATIQFDNVCFRYQPDMYVFLASSFFVFGFVILMPGKR